MDISKESDLVIDISEKEPENTNKPNKGTEKSIKSISNDFPISILKTQLSSLEAIVKFLRENRKYSYKEIAILLRRNPKTLAVSYGMAKTKRPEKFSKYICASKSRIPLSVFNERLSILEAIITYLRSRDMSYSEIARFINKDPRTVWTVCRRAEKRTGEKIKNNILEKDSNSNNSKNDS
jgi:DNA-binding CsgD family transcriptional regulator